MSGYAEKGATETLRCIYCQRTISWPMAQVYPRECLHCGRWPAYKAERPIPPAVTDAT